MITTRPAVPDDVDDVLAILEPLVKAQQLLPRSRDEIQLLMRHGFVAVHNDQIVGFAALEVYSPKLAEIQCLAVAPSAQRQGIGRRLVRLCVERAEREGVFELLAITDSEALFMDCGFHYSLPNQKRALFFQTRPAK